jgi:hypothetical protein
MIDSFQFKHPRKSDAASDPRQGRDASELDVEIAVAKRRALACVSAMRSILRFFGLAFFLGAALDVQGQLRVQFRPAVLGTGPESLVNRIDAEALLKKGQKDGAVMFCAIVGRGGEATSGWTYRAMPGSADLEIEVEQRLQGVKFTPPIYNHQPVGVLLYGTVVFSAEKKPHVHIFLNQDPEEIKAENDFVGPQPVIGGDSKFKGVRVPDPNMPVSISGIANLSLKVGADGSLQDLQLLGEEPPLLGFGNMALEDFNGAKFIPAFRDGDPTASETVLPVCYKPQPAAGDD